MPRTMVVRHSVWFPIVLQSFGTATIPKQEFTNNSKTKYIVRKKLPFESFVPQGRCVNRIVETIGRCTSHTRRNFERLLLQSTVNVNPPYTSFSMIKRRRAEQLQLVQNAIERRAHGDRLVLEERVPQRDQKHVAVAAAGRRHVLKGHIKVQVVQLVQRQLAIRNVGQKGVEFGRVAFAKLDRNSHVAVISSTTSGNNNMKQ